MIITLLIFDLCPQANRVTHQSLELSVPRSLSQQRNPASSTSLYTSSPAPHRMSIPPKSRLLEPQTCVRYFLERSCMMYFMHTHGGSRWLSQSRSLRVASVLLSACAQSGPMSTRRKLVLEKFLERSMQAEIRLFDRRGIRTSGTLPYLTHTHSPKVCAHLSCLSYQ